MAEKPTSGVGVTSSFTSTRECGQILNARDQSKWTQLWATDLFWPGRFQAPRWLESAPVILVTAGFLIWMIKPVGDMWLTMGTYLLVGLGAVVRGLFWGFWLDRRLRLLFMISLSVGLLGSVYGAILQNPGVANEFVFFVALPIAWLVITSGIDLPILRVVINAIPFAGLTIGLLGVFYWLDASGQLDLGWITFVDLGQGIGDEGYGYVLRFYPISSLVFMLSFFFVSLIVPNTYSWWLSRAVAWPAAVSVFFLLFIGGRRALFVSLVLSVVIAFLLLFLVEGQSRLRQRFYLIGVSAALVGAVVTVVSRFSPANMVQSILRDLFSADSVRAVSGEALIDSWLQSPLIGHGLGATVEGSIRSPSRPWNFELQYHMMLNSIGLIGFLMLAVVAILLFVIAIRVYRFERQKFAFLAAVVTGALSLVIANATNPYMHTPGHYWMFFFLALAVNSASRATGVAGRGAKAGLSTEVQQDG